MTAGQGNVVVHLDRWRGHARPRGEDGSPTSGAQQPAERRSRVAPIAPLLAGALGLVVAVGCVVALVALSPAIAAAVLAGGTDA